MNNDYDFNEFVEQCYAFNEIAGKASQSSLKQMLQQLALIEEEVQEIKEGLHENNVLETLDGVVDVLVVTLGMLQKLEALGVDTTKALKGTAENNLTKYPADIATAVASQKYLAKQGAEVTVEYNPKYDLYVLKDKNQKVRKPWNFDSNDLTECIPVQLMLDGFEDEF